MGKVRRLIAMVLFLGAVGFGGTGTSAPAASAGPKQWTLRFSDDFNGATVNKLKWSVYGPSRGHAGIGRREPAQVRVHGGMLDITAQMVNGKVWSGGVAARFGARYGRYEVRIRTDSDPASVMGGAALTWPDSGKWPCEGELDFYETRAGIAGDYIHSFLHYGCANKQHWIGNGYSGEDWHVMVMEWEPNSIRVYKDGVLTGRLADPAKIPDFSHHLTVQLDPRSRRSLIVPVHLNVDYVRIYTR